MKTGEFRIYQPWDASVVVAERQYQHFLSCGSKKRMGEDCTHLAPCNHNRWRHASAEHALIQNLHVHQSLLCLVDKTDMSTAVEHLDNIVPQYWRTQVCTQQQACLAQKVLRHC